MAAVENLRIVRRDGRLIDSPVTVEKLMSLGLKAEKTVAVEWEYKGQTVVRRAPKGMLARLAEGGDLLAVIEDETDCGVKGALSVFNADGSLRLVVPNEQVINGRVVVHGEFCWFEPPRSKSVGRFGVIYRITGPSHHGGDYQLDIDGLNGSTLGVYETR
jgi:hypothetical protein